MIDNSPFQFDRIGYWSEVKLDIVQEYAKAYSRLLSARTKPSLYHIYVDAFAGAGVHLSKTSGQVIEGSPLNALSVDPPFREYHFIDLDGEKILHLRSLVGQRENVYFYEGDCNKVLLDNILPRCRYKDYRRALWLLDPYGIHLNWPVIERAGRERSVDIFLNFPVMDMNRNVLWRNRAKVSLRDAERMNAFWGDESWEQAAYSPDLFGYSEKTHISGVVDAFRKRLLEVAGFTNVPEPIPMRNTNGAILYYLFFASQKPVAQKIVRDIFKKYKNRR